MSKRKKKQVHRPSGGPTGRPAGEGVSDDRKERILDARIKGFTSRQIAEELGISQRRVNKVVRDSLREVLPEMAKELKSLMMEQLDALTEAVMGKALEGDTNAVHAYLAVHDRKARLLGVNEPEKVANQSLGKDGHPVDPQPVIPVINLTIGGARPRPPS